MKMRKFINPLFCSTIPKLIISNVSSISNPLELKYLIKLFQNVKYGSTSKTNVHSLHYVENRSRIRQHESYYV